MRKDRFTLSPDTADGRVRPARPVARRLAQRPAQPRRHHHPRPGERHVGRSWSRFRSRSEWNTSGGTDLTTTWTGEGQAAVFITVDHHSAECVGIHAARRATRFEVLEPLRQGVRRCFGAFGKEIAQGLAVRHGHRSQYMSDTFRKELAFLGIESSPAFVRAPEGNGCAERFIRTHKENLLWVRSFDTVEQLRQAPIKFRDAYNATWLIEQHGFRPPAAIRVEQLPTAALAA